jgi:hypothetical protein
LSREGGHNPPFPPERRGHLKVFSEELKQFLVQILGSWQVITAAVIVLLYVTLVSYVAKFRRGKVKLASKPKTPKPPKKKPEVSKEDEDDEERFGKEE